MRNQKERLFNNCIDCLCHTCANNQCNDFNNAPCTGCNDCSGIIDDEDDCPNEYKNDEDYMY